jgi:transposase
VNNSITYVAMDTHKKQHRIAIAYPNDEVIVEFSVKNTAPEIRKMVRKIKKNAPGEVKFCYEAGVCGFTLQRRIEALKCKCSVIAPSLIPRKPGERKKTDRRDAKKLLGLFMSDMLTEVCPPDEQQEAARELTRCREAAQENLKRIRHQLQKMLVRHGYVFIDGQHWTQKHYRWLEAIQFDQPLLQEVFDSYFTEMRHCLQRVNTLDKELEKLAQSEDYREAVGILCCFYGIKTLTAISIIAEIFDFGRFASARDLMSYLGLTPSESSSGEKEHKGPITKTGNKRVRRLLTEVAWHHRHAYGVSKVLRKRREGQPQWAIDIADRAGIRLRRRYRRLVNRGKLPCKAVTAVARELAGFIWSALIEYEARKNRKKAA